MKDLMRAALESAEETTTHQGAKVGYVFKPEAIETIDTLAESENVVHALDELTEVIDTLESKEEATITEVHLAAVAMESISRAVGIKDTVTALESVGSPKEDLANLKRLAQTRATRMLKAAVESTDAALEANAVSRAHDNVETDNMIQMFKRKLSTTKKEVSMMIEHHGRHDFLTVNNKHLTSFAGIGKDDISFLKDCVKESKIILKDLEDVAADVSNDNKLKVAVSKFAVLNGSKSLGNLAGRKLLNNGFVIRNNRNVVTDDGHDEVSTPYLDVDYRAVANDGSTASFLKRFGYAAGYSTPGALISLGIGVATGSTGVGVAVALPLVGLWAAVGVAAADYSERGSNTRTPVSKSDIQDFLSLAQDALKLSSELDQIHEEIKVALTSIKEILLSQVSIETELTQGDTMGRALDIAETLINKGDSKTKSLTQRERLTLEIRNVINRKSLTFLSISEAATYHTWLITEASRGIVDAMDNQL